MVADRQSVLHAEEIARNCADRFLRIISAAISIPIDSVDRLEDLDTALRDNILAVALVIYYCFFLIIISL